MVLVDFSGYNIEKIIEISLILSQKIIKIKVIRVTVYGLHSAQYRNINEKMLARTQIGRQLRGMYYVLFTGDGGLRYHLHVMAGRSSGTSSDGRR